LSSLLCTCATKQSKKYKKIDNYLSTHFKQYDSKENNCLFLLTEQGCIPCIKEFAKLIKDYKNKQNTYIVICADGGIVDISPFINDSTLINIYNDAKFVFSKEILPFFSAIFLKKERIDTIIEIKALALQGIFTFIKEKADLK
jgi:hypothetical protein